jgi:hypothetical protein
MYNRNYVPIGDGPMKLVLYDETNQIIEVQGNIKSPVVNENNVVWEGGSLLGINLPFLLIEDDVVLTDQVNEEIIALNKRDQFLKVDLQSRLEAAEMAIISLMDFM